MSLPCMVDGIRYEVFTMADVESLVHVVSHAFSGFEPMTTALGISYDDFCFFMNKLAVKAAAEELSIIARNPQDGVVIGALVCEDLMGEPPAGLEEVTPMLDPIFTLLDGLSEPYRVRKGFNFGECLHVFMMAVLKNVTGKDIAQEMVNQSLSHARERGYFWTCTEATGVVSQYIFKEKHGYHKLEETFYRDFVFHGERIFAKIEKHPSAAMMERSLEDEA